MLKTTKSSSSPLSTFACLLLLVAAAPLLAQATSPDIHQRDKPADAAELASIADRGRAIAAYDAAAWHATDEVQALHPKDGSVEMYIGRQTNAGWVVAFGKLNATKDAFLLAFEAIPTADIKHPSVKVTDPPIEDRGQWLQEARSIETARAALKNPGRPYNLTVLSAPKQEWYVYAYPAQTIDSVFPTGADTRYRISPDGAALEEVHKMHVSILDYKLQEQNTNGTFHTAILDDAPEDTDVANVLMMGGIPMYIAGRNFVYRINADGTPVFLATTKDFLKGAKK